MFIGHMSPEHSQVNVGTSSTQVLAAGDPARVKYRFIQNTSTDTDMWLSLGVAAEMSKGIFLPKNGGYYEMCREKGNLYVGACYAIHGGTGDKVAAITEGA